MSGIVSWVVCDELHVFCVLEILAGNFEPQQGQGTEKRAKLQILVAKRLPQKETTLIGWDGGSWSTRPRALPLNLTQEQLLDVPAGATPTGTFNLIQQAHDRVLVALVLLGGFPQLAVGLAGRRWDDGCDFSADGC